MREMKDSGIEWIGDVPRDWEIVRVKEKYSFNTGFTPDTQQSNYYNDENGYEWATITDIVGGKVSTPTKSLVSRSFIEQYHKKIIGLPYIMASLLFFLLISIQDRII